MRGRTIAFVATTLLLAGQGCQKEAPLASAVRQRAPIAEGIQNPLAKFRKIFTFEDGKELFSDGDTGEILKGGFFEHAKKGILKGKDGKLICSGDFIFAMENTYQLKVEGAIDVAVYPNGQMFMRIPEGETPKQICGWEMPPHSGDE